MVEVRKGVNVYRITYTFAHSKLPAVHVKMHGGISDNITVVAYDVEEAIEAARAHLVVALRDHTHVRSTKGRLRPESLRFTSVECVEMGRPDRAVLIADDRPPVEPEVEEVVAAEVDSW